MCVWTGKASLKINLNKASSGESKDHGHKLNKLQSKAGCIRVMATSVSESSSSLPPRALPSDDRTNALVHTQVGVGNSLRL